MDEATSPGYIFQVRGLVASSTTVSAGQRQLAVRLWREFCCPAREFSAVGSRDTKVSGNHGVGDSAIANSYALVSFHIHGWIVDMVRCADFGTPRAGWRESAGSSLPDFALNTAVPGSSSSRSQGN